MKTPKVDKRPAYCPGCCPALLRARRARRGPFCHACLQELVWGLDHAAKGKS